MAAAGMHAQEGTEHRCAKASAYAFQARVAVGGRKHTRQPYMRRCRVHAFDWLARNEAGLWQREVEWAPCHRPGAASAQLRGCHARPFLNDAVSILHVAHSVIELREIGVPSSYQSCPSCWIAGDISALAMASESARFDLQSIGLRVEPRWLCRFRCTCS